MFGDDAKHARNCEPPVSEAINPESGRPNIYARTVFKEAIT